MKKLLALLLALVMVLALAACGGEATSAPTPDASSKPVTSNDPGVMNDDNHEAVESAVVAEVCRIAIESVSTLTPWGTNNGLEPLYEVYQCLFSSDSTGELFPVLADRTRGEFGGYDHTAGSSDYTVYIYDYIKDHAGNDITADDVKWAFEHQFNEEFTSGWDAFDSVEVVDPTTITFHFKRELNKIGELTNIWARCFIISQKAYEGSQSKLSVDMCGTGPYVLDKFVSGAEVVLTKNDNYWQTNTELIDRYQLANVQKIVYKFIDDSAQELIALETGEIDVCSSVPASNLSTFSSDKFGVYNWLQKGVKALMPNGSDDSICSDVNMRIAILYAIDVKGLCTAYGEDSVAPAYALMSSYFSEYNTEWDTWENCQNVCDLELSKSYLDKAGYKGEEIRLFCEGSHSSDAEVIASMLENAGIKCSVNIRDRNGMNDVKTTTDGWDLLIDRNAGSSGSDQLNKLWAQSNSKDGKTTQTFIKDDEWEQMLQTLRTAEGGTVENYNAWMQRAYDNGYGIALYMDINNIVYRDYISTLYRTDKNALVPGAFTYNTAK